MPNFPPGPGAPHYPYPHSDQPDSDERRRTTLLTTEAAQNATFANPILGNLAAFSQSRPSATPVAAPVPASHDALRRLAQAGEPIGAYPGVHRAGHVPTAATVNMQTSSSVAASFSQDPYKAAQALPGKLNAVGLKLLINSREEAGYDCSLMTLMHQLKGVPAEQAEEIALRKHADLVKGSSDLGKWLLSGVGVHNDPLMFQALTQQIFDHGNPPVMLIMMASDHGMPLLRDPFRPLADSLVDPSSVLHDTAMLFMRPTGRFDAVINVSGCPWPDLLKQLRIVVHETEATCTNALLRHRIRSVRQMAIITIDRYGMERKYQWKRGVQTSLTPAFLGEEQPSWPLLARQLARAQFMVDDFWTALEYKTSSLWGQLPSAQDGEIYRLHVESQMDNYTADLQLPDDRVIKATINGEYGGSVVVEYEDPSTRELNSLARDRLTHYDDYDAFDDFALTSDDMHDRYAFSKFLEVRREEQQEHERMQGQQRMQGQDLDTFIRDWPSLSGRLYLTNAVKNKKLRSDAPAGIRRALNIVAENRRRAGQLF